MSELIIILSIFAVIITVPTAIVFSILSCNKARKKKCTVEVKGTIVKYRHHDGNSHITVAYNLDGVTYKRTEQIRRIKTKTYKIGAIPIGGSYESSLRGKNIGDDIVILYNPKKPKSSCIRDNIGTIVS